MPHWRPSSAGSADLITCPRGAVLATPHQQEAFQDQRKSPSRPQTRADARRKGLDGNRAKAAPALGYAAARDHFCSRRPRFCSLRPFAFARGLPALPSPIALQHSLPPRARIRSGVARGEFCCKCLFSAHPDEQETGRAIAPSTARTASTVVRIGRLPIRLIPCVSVSRKRRILRHPKRLPQNRF